MSKELGIDFQGQRQDKGTREEVNPDVSRSPWERVTSVLRSSSTKESALDPPAIPLPPLW